MELLRLFGTRLVPRNDRRAFSLSYANRRCFRRVTSAVGIVPQIGQDFSVEQLQYVLTRFEL